MLHSCWRRVMSAAAVCLICTGPPVVASAVYEQTTDSRVREHSLRSDPFSEIRPQGLVIPVDHFLKQGYRIGPVAIVSDSAVVVTDVENAELHLFDWVAETAQLVARFGEGPGEIRNVIAVVRSGSGFVVLDNVGTGVRVSTVIGLVAVKHFDTQGRFVREELLRLDPRAKLSSLTFTSNGIVALDQSEAVRPVRDESGATAFDTDPTELRVVRIDDDDGAITALDMEPWRQKLTIRSDMENSNALVGGTLVAASAHFILLTNRFLHFHALFDHEGNLISQVNVRGSVSGAEEYSPGARTSRFRFLIADAIVDDSGLIHIARTPDSGEGSVDVWTEDGTHVTTVRVDCWPEYIDVRSGQLLVGDGFWRNGVWLYDYDHPAGPPASIEVGLTTNTGG